MNRRKLYQNAGEKEKKGQAYYDERDRKLKEWLTSGLTKIGTGFTDALHKNIEGTINPLMEDATRKFDEGREVEGLAQGLLTMGGPGMLGILPQAGGYGITELAKYLINNARPGMTKEEREEFNKSFRPHSHTTQQRGGIRRYQKGGQHKPGYKHIKKKKGKSKTIYTGHVGDPEEVHSKKVIKRKKNKTTIRERSDTYAGKSSDSHTYGDKKLEKRRFKSTYKKDFSKEAMGTLGFGDLNETKRKESITYDGGNQSKKRTQRKIRFGKNKGKYKSKTVHWNRGKRTVTKKINNKINTSKLQKGGFLEAPIPRLFED